MVRILVVDDDPIVTHTIDRTLRICGYETIVVHNGWDAIEMAQTKHPDMIVLDVVMPGMDGVEVCRQLRDDPTTSWLPILFLTARVMIDAKLRAFEAGADDYLTKPFDLQELSLRVKALLRRAQMQPPAEIEEEEEIENLVIVGDLALNRQTFQASTPEHTILLTPIEFELLDHLMTNAGRIFSSEILLQEVWNYPPGTGDPALVRMHIRNLRLKLEPKDTQKPVFIRTVSRRGYTIRADLATLNPPD